MFYLICSFFLVWPMFFFVLFSKGFKVQSSYSLRRDLPNYIPFQCDEPFCWAWPFVPNCMYSSVNALTTTVHSMKKRRRKNVSGYFSYDLVEKQKQSVYDFCPKCLWVLIEFCYSLQKVLVISDWLGSCSHDSILTHTYTDTQTHYLVERHLPPYPNSSQSSLISDQWNVSIEYYQASDVYNNKLTPTSVDRPMR